VSLSVTFLGTAASRPTVERGTSSLALTREGETLLFDCGEGTQRQMMRYGITFALDDIFVTHWHHDHFLGIAGLMRTLSLSERVEPLRIWGPRGGQRIITQMEQLGHDRLSFPIEVTELNDGDELRRAAYSIRAFAVQHRGATALGYALVEDTRLGRFDPERARELGIPEGPLWGRIHRGESITLDDGRVVAPSELVGPTRPGRTVVYTGDTRPCAATIDAALDADLLVHEATFGDDEADRARETGHSTAREAAQVAAGANVRRLLMTHVSARYSWNTSDLEREAREVFAAASYARDGGVYDVPFQESTALPAATLPS
jgi:ribonuclease Z